MPLAFDVDHDRRRIRTVATGPLTCPDLTDHLAALAGAAGYPEFIDARAATVSPAVTYRDVERAARLLADPSAGRGAARVAVVTEVPVTFGVACQLAVLAGPACDVRPFRDLAAATEWLGWT